MAQSVARAIKELKELRRSFRDGDRFDPVVVAELIDILTRLLESAKPVGGADGKKDALLTSVEPGK